MKAIFILGVLLFLKSITSLQAQNASELQTLIDAGIDPYFVKSQDTFSKYGPNCITRDVLQDRKGIFWLASWQGIIKYDGKIFTNYTLKDGLIKFHVISCHEDRKGNLWFGTARGGLYRYDGQSFKLFTTKDGLPDNSVICFAEDKLGNLWLGTDKGASRYDGRVFTNFTTVDGLITDNVRAITIDRNGRILLGCGGSKYGANDGGICKFNGKLFNQISMDTTSLNIVALLEDKTGTLWIGTMSGLFKYYGKALEPVTSVPPHLAYYIIEDKKGQIWLSTGEPNPIHKNIAKQTLFRYDGRSYTRTVEKTEPGDFQLFGKTVDKEGRIWFGTMKGVCCYDGNTVITFTK